MTAKELAEKLDGIQYKELVRYRKISLCLCGSVQSSCKALGKRG